MSLTHRHYFLRLLFLFAGVGGAIILVSITLFTIMCCRYIYIIYNICIIIYNIYIICAADSSTRSSPGLCSGGRRAGRGRAAARRLTCPAPRSSTPTSPTTAPTSSPAMVSCWASGVKLYSFSFANLNLTISNQFSYDVNL